MNYEKATPALDRLNQRRAELAAQLAEVSIMACNEEGVPIEHPIIYFGKRKTPLGK